MRTMYVLAPFVFVSVLEHAARAEDLSDDTAAIATTDAAKTSRLVDPFLRFSIGGRVGRNTSAGYDAFSNNDALGNLELTASMRVLQKGPWSLAVGLAYDVTGSTGDARGQRTNLGAFRFSAPVEGRYRLSPGFVPLVRLAPGLLYATQSLETGSETLHASGNHVSIDGSIGTAILLGAPDPKRHFRAWFVPRVGYAWSTARTPSLTVDDPNAILGQSSGRTLPSLALRGPYLAAEIALAY